MTAERDRLMRTLHDAEVGCATGDDQAADFIYHGRDADRLIAAGVSSLDSIPPDMTDYMAGYRQGQSDLDVERLARALHKVIDGGRLHTTTPCAAGYTAVIDAIKREAEG